MEIKLTTVFFSKGKVLLLLMMRTFIILFCTTVFSLTPKELISQNTKVTIDADKEVTIDEVFDLITNQTKYAFMYQADLFKDFPKAHLKKGVISMDKLIKECLAGGNLNIVLGKDNTILIKEATTQQQIKVSGKVTDEAGIPVIGATVLIKGTFKGTATDFDGSYTITVANPENVLVFSSLGFESQEITVGNKNTINVILKENISALDEVTINAGYYSTTERLKTGNISKVDSKELSLSPVTDPMAALQGRLPGVVITQSSGNPGAAFEVEIRGRTQIDNINGASDEPLYIIDNVPIASGNEYINQIGSAISASSLSGLSPLYSLNLGDIESVEVLKDADATAIYGSRGASGVILITTKKGKKGKPKFSLSVSNGVSTAPLPDMLTTKEYVAMRKEALKNDGLDLETLANSTSLSNRNKVYDLAQYDTIRDNNLAEQLIGGTAYTTDVQASFSGGSDLTQFILGGSYHKETMVIPGDFPNSRASGRFNVTTTTPNKKFTGVFSTSYASTLNTSTSTDLSFALSLPPNYKLYEDNGDLAWNEGGYESDNPLAYTLQKYEAISTTLNANAVLSYKILPSVTLKNSIGYNFITTDENRIRPSTAVNPLDRTGADGTYLFGHRTFKSWILEPQLDYLKPIGKGTLNVLIGGSFQSQEQKSYNIRITGYENDDQIGTLSVVTPEMLNSAPSSNFSEYKYAAFFGRANYNYDDKYILNLTGRRDGSSRFGPDFRFSNFGAIGAAWILSNESFMKGIPFISFAKLRASYGVTGNDKIGNYKYQDVYESGFSLNSYNGATALTPASLFNSDLHWERNVKTEVSMDLNVFKDRLQFLATWYRNNSSDPLVSFPLPRMTGYNSVVNNLNGVIVQNQGVELQLTTTNFQNKNFSWRTNFNITIPSNKLLEYPNFEDSPFTSYYVIGQSLNTVIAGHVVGVDPETGLYFLEDYNDNGVYDPSEDEGDFKPQFDTDPDFYGGLQNSLSYKGITLDFLFQFRKQIGKNWLSSYTSFTSPVGAVGINYPDVVLDRWQNPGDITGIQKFTTSASFFDLSDLNGGHVPAYFSDLQYTDVSFVRLKNVSLSYDLPEKLLNEIGVSSLRVYAQGQNLLTFTPYKTGDPESASLTRLPPLRTIIIGAQISF
ncbi:SusC/RagA family TonB-linked outer membrane protein [Flavivirga sp. 57AJ16]|uniref:SusC/RagA family TonB-linked outer membrane protein n=1 Tax=Flavivirga sp. 57AJ16 TaxID=3025307 RepID=UPI002366DAE5|nr:SusC/RagA family TonB-linked outer membrane protein [Flavivirga sp. 57AJ16]MDD7888136.1 SusC/RagA family TonB-linked outer membrane protein [Flavivirga sp. 57AJ16]